MSIQENISSRVASLALRVGAEFRSIRNEIDEIESELPTVDVITKLLIDISHPVGSWYASDDPTDPSVLFPGTTWERLTGKKGLVACNDDTDASSEGGKSSVTLTTEQLPSHTHTQESCDTQGAHNHGRGTQDITGSFAVGKSINEQYSAKDAFYYVGASTVGGSSAGWWGKAPQIGLQASKKWSGSTDSKGGHSHTITLNTTGSGQSIDIMNPYHATYIWKRIS